MELQCENKNFCRTHSKFHHEVEQASVSACFWQCKIWLRGDGVLQVDLLFVGIPETQKDMNGCKGDTQWCAEDERSVVEFLDD